VYWIGQIAANGGSLGYDRVAMHNGWHLAERIEGQEFRRLPLPTPDVDEFDIKRNAQFLQHPMYGTAA